MIAARTAFDRHRDGETIRGLLNSIPSTLLCEMAGRAGFDFLVLDLEHLPHDETALAASILACEVAGIEPWVRLPDPEPKRIGRLLDAGAAAIVLPHWRRAEEVRAAVSAAWFPPWGRRGITGGRPTGFGRLSLPDYVDSVNRRALVVPMVETAAALDALPALLTEAGAGLAAVLEGALDLALDLGVGPDPMHPVVQDSVRRAADACDAARVPFIANPRDAVQTERWRARGVRMLLGGEDRGLFLAALRNRRQEF